MKSFRKTMIHNERRAAEMRLYAADAVRAVSFDLRAHLSKRAIEEGDSYIAIITAQRSKGQRPNVSVIPSFYFGDGNEVEALKRLYESMMNYLDDPLKLFNKSSSDEDIQGAELVGLVTVQSVRGMDAEIAMYGRRAAGTLARIRFVDGSDTVILIDEDGLVPFAGSTHPVADIYYLEINNVRKVPSDRVVQRAINEAREVGKKIPRNIDKRIEEAEFHEAMITGILTMSPEERQMFA